MASDLLVEIPRARRELRELHELREVARTPGTDA
jgi:hypothetical protein